MPVYLHNVLENRSGYFNLVDNLADDFLGGDVVGFRLVGQADTMAQHIMSHGTDIFGYHISATLDECVCYNLSKP